MRIDGDTRRDVGSRLPVIGIPGAGRETRSLTQLPEPDFQP